MLVPIVLLHLSSVAAASTAVLKAYSLNTDILKNLSYSEASTSHAFEPTLLRKRSTDAFQVDISCNTVLMYQGVSVCNFIETGMRNAFQRISQVVYLPETVRVAATISGQCNSTSCANGGRGVLASAAPSSWYAISKESAFQYGLDPDYMYPSSLLRQYAPDDPVFVNAVRGRTGYYDIQITYNADMNWWVSNPDNPSGNTETVNTPTGTSAITGNSLKFQNGNQFDIEQVSLHELIHGLGFISSWYDWMNLGIMSPGWLDKNAGSVAGMSHPFIFDKYLFDSKSNQMVSTYTRAIRNSAANMSQSVNTSSNVIWFNEFNKTTGGQLLSYVNNTLLVSPQSLLRLYPIRTLRNETTTLSKKSLILQLNNQSLEMNRVFLHTPTKYSPGTSLSHFDAGYYDGTVDFLMRPFGTPGIGIDAYFPQSQFGPIGPETLGILRSMGYSTALGPLE